MKAPDFASMKVGDEYLLPEAKWDDQRSVFEACMEYVRATNPTPKFSFQRGKVNGDGLATCTVTRTR